MTQDNKDGWVFASDDEGREIRDNAPNFRDVDSCYRCAHMIVFPSYMCHKHTFSVDAYWGEAFVKRCDDWKEVKDEPTGY